MDKDDRKAVWGLAGGVWLIALFAWIYLAILHFF